MGVHRMKMRGELGRTLHEVEQSLYETCVPQWRNQAGRYHGHAWRIVEGALTPFRAILRVGLLLDEDSPQ